MHPAYISKLVLVIQKADKIDGSPNGMVIAGFCSRTSSDSLKNFLVGSHQHGGGLGDVFFYL